MRRIILLIVLGVLVGGGVYELLKTQKRPEEKPDLKLTADLEARGVTLMGQSDKGSWELKIGRLIDHLGEDLI